MKGITIVKLGGSIITDKKGGKPVVHRSVVQRLAREMRGAGPLIVLYGGGSFGHPLARKFRLPGRALSRESVKGFALTTRSMQRLGGQLAELLMREGLSVFPLQTSAFVREEGGKLIFSNIKLLRAANSAGAVLLMGGDGMIADGTRIEIVSADRLAANLAGLFGSKRIVFATDVDGVFKHFPPRRGEKPLATLTRAELTGVRASRMKLEGDVTGGMAGKLAALTKLRGVTVIVCNGNKKGALKTALRGGVVGTRITL